MKYTVNIMLSILLAACGSKTGMEEKELATQAFIDCDFHTAITNSEMAIEYAGSNPKVSVPALLILGKSFEFLENESASISAYEKIVQLAPGVSNILEAKEIASNFVKQVSQAAPHKVKNCPEFRS